MGRCRYCQQSAGFLSSEHPDCSKAAELHRAELRSMLRQLVRGEIDGEQAAITGERVATVGRLSEGEVRKVLSTSLDGFVREFAYEQPVSEPTLDRILALYTKLLPNWETLGVEQKVQMPGYLTLLHSGTLYDVLHGSVPISRHPGMASGFRLGMTESPIVRRGALLAEHHAARSGSTFQSVGVPVGMGLYYRIGVSQSHSGRAALTQVDKGILLLTTEAIYFSGDSSTFKIAYDSILRANLCDGGFEVFNISGTGRVFLPFALGTVEENWYFYNIVATLANVS